MPSLRAAEVPEVRTRLLDDQVRELEDWARLDVLVPLRPELELEVEVPVVLVELLVSSDEQPRQELPPLASLPPLSPSTTPQWRPHTSTLPRSNSLLAHWFAGDCTVRFVACIKGVVMQGAARAGEHRNLCKFIVKTQRNEYELHIIK